MSNAFKLRDNTNKPIEPAKHDVKKLDPKAASWQLKSFIPTPIGNQKDGVQKNNYNSQTTKFVAKGSKFQELLNECKTKNKQYMDKEFLPNTKSIIGFQNPTQAEDYDMAAWKKMTWKTPSQAWKYDNENGLECGEQYKLQQNGTKIFLTNFRI